MPKIPPGSAGIYRIAAESRPRCPREVRGFYSNIWGVPERFLQLFLWDSFPSIPVYSQVRFAPGISPDLGFLRDPCPDLAPPPSPGFAASGRICFNRLWGFVGIAFSRSACPHVLGDLLQTQGTDTIPGCRLAAGCETLGFVPHRRIYPHLFNCSTCCSCIFQDELHFPGVSMFSCCWYSKFQDCFHIEGFI